MAQRAPSLSTTTIGSQTTDTVGASPGNLPLKPCLMFTTWYANVNALLAAVGMLWIGDDTGRGDAEDVLMTLAKAATEVRDCAVNTLFS